MGFRGDWNLDGGRRLTVSGAAGGGESGDQWRLPSLVAPSGFVPTRVSQKVSSANLLARHEWRLGERSDATVCIKSVLPQSGTVARVQVLRKNSEDVLRVVTLVPLGAGGDTAHDQNGVDGVLFKSVTRSAVAAPSGSGRGNNPGGRSMCQRASSR